MQATVHTYIIEDDCTYYLTRKVLRLKLPQQGNSEGISSVVGKYLPKACTLFGFSCSFFHLILVKFGKNDDLMC